MPSFFKHSLCCCKTSDWNSEWRARHIVESSSVEEFDGIRITTVLTANTDFQIGLSRTPTFNAYFNKLTYTFLIKASEWVVTENLCILIGW